MRHATWESSPGALAALLNGINRTVLFMADLYTLTLNNELVARWTSADQNVTVGARTFVKDPIIERDTVRFVVGAEVDTLSVSLTPKQEGTYIKSIPLLQWAVNRGFDGCRITLERAYSSMPGAPFVGALLLFDGRISEATISRNAIYLTVKSDLELLDQQFPKNLYQSACSNVMYDAACGLTRTQVSTTAIGKSNVTRTAFPIDLGIAAGDYYALGTVEFVTGANSGVRRSIRSSNETQITLMAALPGDVMPGDQIKLVRGCDRTQATCQRLNNLIHFRGCPYIPKPETILSGA